jgi:hypothetical protein
MARSLVSQRTIVEVMRSLREFANVPEMEEPPDFSEVCYANDFPDWFVIHAESHYDWNWKQILIDLRNTAFFFPSTSVLGDNIVGEFLSQPDAALKGEALIGRLAALAATLPTGESVLRSLQLDGYDIDKNRLRLVPLEGPVSAAEEEDRLGRLAKASGIPETPTILRHMTDAHSLYTGGEYHPSLNESRSLIQALVDGISVETDRHGKHSVELPGGTANRIDYLSKVGFFTADEKAALLSGWGSLSAGSHPGVPEREQARIGLVLALEFGQILMWKFANWKTNAYRGFS